MRIAITGPNNLTEKQEDDVQFLLDSVCCRYANECITLVHGGRSGVESIADALAKKWKWAAIDEKKPSLFGWWVSDNLDLDRQIAKDCDLLISFQHRNYNHSSIADRTADLDKKVLEFYI